MLNNILSFVLFIISLSILIIIHELGHLTTAKMFNVYCQEFSVGFGPALLHKRKKGKETYFSIRAIPLGGYVSMYGEETNLEEGVNIPKERSIEGIKRWKKAIIVSAGIILNAVLALTLFAISNICFPLVQQSTFVSINETSSLYEQGLRNDDRLYFIPNENGEIFFQDQYDVDGTTHAAYFYIVNDDVDFNENKYVLVYYPNGNKSDSIFTESFYLFPSLKDENVKELDVWKNWDLKNYPDYKNGYYKVNESDVVLNTKISFYVNNGSDENGKINYLLKEFNLTIKSEETSPGSGQFKWSDIGLSFKIVEKWLPFNERIANTFVDFGNASVAVFKGLGSLFTGGIKNMSGIIGIFTTSSQILNQYTFSTYLYFWGLISVNLAIFNLLPFPGLDGWQLLVTAIEGSVNSIKKAKYKKNYANLSEFKEWKIPSKIKNTVSFIGMALLFALMIAIVVMDIIRLV